MTLSRTAALSRQLSIFFKYYIRFLLKNGEYSLEGNEGIKERQATIVNSVVTSTSVQLGIAQIKIVR